MEAHFVLWVGMLMTLAAAVWALRTEDAEERGLGYRVTFVGALAYIPVAVWHFIGHANGEDLQVAHVLLAVAQVGTIVGALTATMRSRRPAAARIE